MPKTCAVTPAGFISGPSVLKMVRMPISRLGPAANRIAGWKVCANMNPNPASSMHRATPSGPSAMFTPSSSSTSALPVEPDAARFPCLATFTPAPAATSPTVVEMLKVWDASPPVPHVSTSGPSTSTESPLLRITPAMPVISSSVSPLTRRAVRNAPSWAGAWPRPP